MTPDGPTLGEVMRGVDDLKRQLGEVSKLIASERAESARIYVRSDVFAAERSADAIQLQGLEQEVHSLSKRIDESDARKRTDRALILSGLIFPIVVALVVAAVLAR